MRHAIAHRPTATEGGARVVASLALPHDERHLRRRRFSLEGDDAVLVDLPAAVQMADGAVLVCEDGSEILIRAAPEALYAVSARDSLHLAELAWHIGNRHLPAEIEASRILILRDHVIKAMVEGLGGTVTEIVGPFTPVRGAYHHAHAETAHGHRHAGDDHAPDNGHRHG